MTRKSCQAPFPEKLCQAPFPLCQAPFPPPTAEKSCLAQLSVRVRVGVGGAVQGVGFRPFAARLAAACGVAGFVRNTEGGAVVEAEGEPAAVAAFRERLVREAPPPVRVRVERAETVAPAGDLAFVVAESEAGRPDAATLAEIPRDRAVCAECVAEIRDPGNRRYRYPFTHCTACGPRWSVLRALPYDRARTSLAPFPPCAACRAEFADPANRRFHAQNVACPDCGPRVTLRDAAGRAIASDGRAPLAAAAERIRRGAIVALKGLGGYQLLCDARDGRAVERLRLAKGRPGGKPLAVMAPSLEWVRAALDPEPLEESLLASPEAPIVLVRRRAGTTPFAEAVAPRSPLAGVFLPTTPLHVLLLDDLAFPVVATSGNRSEEPIAFDDADALARLAGLADAFLTHDRAIERPLDDSVARVVGGRELVLRAGRGHAPLPVRLPFDAPPVIALGASAKASPALASGGGALLGAHVGDLESPLAVAALDRGARSLAAARGVARPAAVARDLHPDFPSTRLAAGMALPDEPVAHHHAHAAACLAENGLFDRPALAVVFDGFGLGPDGGLWGGEFLRVDGAACRRVARLREFPLPGGDAAAREPRRSAAGLLFETFGAASLDDAALPPIAAFSGPERATLASMLARGVASPRASSAGRLFDAAASLAGLAQRASFEGEAAVALEAAVRRGAAPYPLPLEDDGALDTRALARAMAADARAGAGAATIASRFHAALVAAILAVARAAGEPVVALSGGCFQNRLLAESAAEALRGAGFRPVLHRLVPPNDGGLSLGQAIVAARRLSRAREG